MHPGHPGTDCAAGQWVPLPGSRMLKSLHSSGFLFILSYGRNLKREREREMPKCGLEGGFWQTAGLPGRTESLFELGDCGRLCPGGDSLQHKAGIRGSRRMQAGVLQRALGWGRGETSLDSDVVESGSWKVRQYRVLVVLEAMGVA